jgi:hypothetical protein
MPATAKVGYHNRRRPTAIEAPARVLRKHAIALGSPRAYMIRPLVS